AKGARGAEALSVALATPGFKAEVGETAHAGARDLVVGLGDRKEFSLARGRYGHCLPVPLGWPVC
ncbi:MAG: hypothetical protein EBU85_05000, partial [Actinobacteria bacterium]|nr:hypothetical protein [Actinomycetota bacterium]